MLDAIWHPDALVFAFSRDGSSAGEDELDVGEQHYRGRLLSVEEFCAWQPDEELADSARALLHVRELARRAVSEGLVFPQLDEIGGDWFAFWGAMLEEKIEATLVATAAAAPAVIADYFHGDRSAVVHDLYPRLVDRIARDRLVAAGVSLGSSRPFGRGRAVEAFLHGLTSPQPDLPHGPSYRTLAKRLERWVDEGLARIVEAPWGLGLHLEERPAGRLALQLWLHAEDDPTVALPASLLWEAGPDAFLFLRDTDPYEDVRTRFAELGPWLVDHGFPFDEEQPDEVELDREDATYFLRRLLPELALPVVLPEAWTSRPARISADLQARATQGVFASFDWTLRVDDLGLGVDELRRLASQRHPVLQAGGRWQALRRDDVQRALRFLETRQSGSLVDLVRAVSGLATDEYGLHVGRVALDEKLSGLLDENAKFAPLPTPAGMQFDLFRFQEAGHGWLRLLGDLGIGCVLADDMGLGKTVQAIAMLVSERDRFGAEALGPTLVVCPMSVARQWVHEVERFAPGLRVHLHHGKDRLQGVAFRDRALGADVVVTSYDIATRDLDSLQLLEWDRVLIDEAQDVKNPQTRRARSLRLLASRRRVAMTGTPIENHLGELWAIMDFLNPGLLGSREWFHRAFTEPIQMDDDRDALERLKAIVRPFILRRTKDDPQVELDLPPITVMKDYCRLTVEQAALYQQTLDLWLPRVEAHEDRFGRRGAVLAMLSQLKQVCNHPEMLLHQGGGLEGRSGKLERLVELLLMVPEHDKSLVFTQYVRFEALVPYLAEKLGKRVEFFHGSLNARQREELLEAFAGPGGPQVLVVSLRAGGRGLNLPAANHVFHFDRWWNPAVEQQATDRAHRLGQEKPVFVHSLITEGTLEERIDQLLESKRELVAKVLAATGEDWLGDLDLAALREAVALAPDAYEQEAA